MKSSKQLLNCAVAIQRKQLIYSVPVDDSGFEHLWVKPVVGETNNASNPEAG
jgi:hypothetical protein